MEPLLLAILRVEFPLEEPVLVFTIAMAAFLLGPLLIKRVGLPGIVGIVLFGVVLGPNATPRIVAHTDAIVLLGEVGLIYLLFTVGLQLDLQGFKDAPQNAALFGLVSFFLPFGVGVAVSYYLLDLSIWASALLSAVFASHTLLAYPIVNRLGVTKNRAVTAVFGGILFTDTISLIVLAIVIGAVGGDLTPLLFVNVFGSLLVLFVGVWVLLPRISRWFFQSVTEESYFEFLFVMVVIFAAASLAALLEIAPILGAFVAGLALNTLIAEGGTLKNRIEFVGNAFLIPFFLLHVGMLVDPGVIFDGLWTIQVAVTIIVTMFVTKAIAAWIVAYIQEYDSNERGVIFGLSTGQAAAALAITLVGFDAGLLDAGILNAVVIMLLVTAVVSPWLTERAATRLALEKDVLDEGEDADDPTILLPLSHGATLQKRLLELAFAIKGDAYVDSNPVHLLTVVRPGGDTPTEQKIASVQSELDGVASFGSAAETPVRTESRVNHNVASGIVQGALEVQATMILMGWDAKRSFKNRIFSTIIDQVLKRTTLPVLVSRLGHPINTTRRIHVILPTGVDHHEGFYEAVHIVKRIAASLGVPITAYTLSKNTHQFERLFELVEEDASATFESVGRWQTLFETLDTQSDDDDLVIALSPRGGDVGWHTELDTLPKRLATMPPASFIVIHPRQGKPEYDRKYLRME